MRKIILFTFAALTVCVSAMAQDGTEEQPRRRGGGFLNALKRGVESSTGLNVSNEPVFVYPEIGVWKISVAKCEGNKEFGSVALTLKVIKISGNNSMGDRCLFTEAKTTDGVELGYGTYSADPLWDFRINAPVEVPMQNIGGVPENATALNIKFYIGSFAGQHNIFEGRDIPITWVEQ